MLRHSFIYLLLSILIVVFAKYGHLFIVYVDLFFTYVNIRLQPVFSQTGWGLVMRKTLVLVIMPVTVAIFPAILYKAISGKHMPHLIALVWVIWLIIALSEILIR